jgi:hypothetical protein
MMVITDAAIQPTKTPICRKSPVNATFIKLPKKTRGRRRCSPDKRKPTYILCVRELYALTV